MALYDRGKRFKLKADKLAEAGDYNEAAKNYQASWLAFWSLYDSSHPMLKKSFRKIL